MIKILQNKNIDISNKIRAVFQLSYAVEAKLLKADHFPPLKRNIYEFLNSKNVFYGYSLNHELVGVIEIDQNSNSTHIQSLVVHPKFFRQGIAQKLIEYIFNIYNSKIFTVETGVDNTPAIELYKKSGFTEIKQWDTDYGIRKIRLEIKNES